MNSDCLADASASSGLSLFRSLGWVVSAFTACCGVALPHFPRLVCQIPGGFSEDSCVLRGIMVNKDVTHPRMRRLIKNPRIVLLDCSLEYKKGESQVMRVPLAAAASLLQCW